MSPDQYRLQMAIQDFQSALQRGAVQEILARITGKSTKLLSYDEVAEKLKLRIRTERGMQQIPLDAIVGSVGRYTEFTRTFLPRRAGDQERWARVKAAMQEGAGLPPIEVYKVGEVYFVIDGNHRVSIARQEGYNAIEARVIEVRTSIKLTPDIRPDDLIVKAEYAEFLNTTGIMDLRPNVDLTVTIPGQYEKMLEQICAQECLLDKERKGASSFQDAVETWYDNIYIPLAETIRDRGLLHWFPDRTITDLYIWISENRAELEQELGWEIQSDITATDLILERSVKSEPGSWRRARTVTRYTDHLFADILVPLSGFSESWDALDQAIIIAQHENAKLHGLHIVDTKYDAESADAKGIKERFDMTCKEAGVEGSLVIDIGDVTDRIGTRASLTDLVVVKIMNPPGRGISALQSPFRTIIERSSRPLLTVPQRASRCKRALLAYDGTDRSKEALFVATYLAEMWKTELIVFTALDGSRLRADVQEYVHRYLEIHEVEAEYIVSEHGAMDSLKDTAEERDVDLVLMGSHGGSVLQQVFVGSMLDYMLRESKVPTFICR
ncbi:MAG: universal stress protein UspA [Anaerolineales bacterium]|nr:universal stress protein [Anaerolineae bacterium]PWB76039.1 MAG: universal stress protein UspA [Anaerolineales bacterium]